MIKNKFFKLLISIFTILLSGIMIFLVAHCCLPTDLTKTNMVFADSAVWDGSTNYAPTDETTVYFDGGDGSSGSPYLISTAEQLARLAGIVNGGNGMYISNPDGSTSGSDYTYTVISGGTAVSAPYLISAYYKLTDNIVLNDVSDFANWSVTAPANSWDTIGSSYKFRGSFDGDNHYVRGLYMRVNGCAGLFGYVSGATIKNLTLLDSYVVGTDKVGGICGYLSENSVITNCVSYATVADKNTTTANNVGGICGYLADTSSITNCKNYGAVTLNYSYSAYCGGICGKSENGTITDCSNSGAINVNGNTSKYFGGICGENGGAISDCSNSGTITVNGTAVKYFGGICGTSTGTISYCINNGLITGTQSDATDIGGISGSNSGAVNACVNTANITNGQSAGGICGLNGYDKNETAVSAVSTITNCINGGSLTSGYGSGGICGINGGANSLITNCANFGNINNAGFYQQGGITGRFNDGSATDVYTICSVSGGNCGMITGTIYGGAISNAYFISTNGLTTATDYLGGGTVFANSTNYKTLLGLGDTLSGITDNTDWTIKASVNTTYYFPLPTAIANSGKTTLIQAAETAVAKTLTLTVSYSANGGTGTMDNSVYPLFNATKTLATNIFTRDDYGFTKWTYNSADYADGANIGSLAFDSPATITFSANWAEKVTLTLDKVLSSATSTQTSVVALNGQSIPTITPPTLSSWTFLGYYSAANGDGTKYINADGTSATTISGTADITLYAYWKHNANVVFNANGGAGTMSNVAYDIGDSITLTANTFTRDKYNFLGWALTSTATTATYANSATFAEANCSQNKVTLYAVWGSYTYTIKFDGNGSTSGTMTDLTVNYGDDVDLTDNAFIQKLTFTITEYVGSTSKLYAERDFLGWSLSSDNTAVYTDGATVSKLTSTDNGTVTLYACWDDASVVLPEKPTREGYTFVAWNYNGTNYSEKTDLLATTSGSIVGIWKALPQPAPTPEPEPEPEPQPEPTPQEKIEASVVPSEDGTFTVDGKYSDGKTYDTLEEALQAAEQNYQKEVGETTVSEFIAETFSDLPGEDINFEEQYIEKLEELQTTEDGLFVVGDMVFENIEEAIAQIVLEVKTQIFETKQDELVSTVNDYIRSCDGESVTAAVNHSAAEIKDLTLDDSADLKDIYAAALNDVAVAKNVQKALNTIADQYNAAYKAQKFTTESLNELYAHWEALNESLQACKTNDQVAAMLEEWNGYMSALKLITVKAEDGTTVSTEAGLSADTTVIVALADKPDVYEQILNAVNSGELKITGIFTNENTIKRVVSEGTLIGVFDISISGFNTEKNGDVYTVRFELPDEYKNYRVVYVIHIGDDGSMQYVKGTVSKGFVIFETDGFSEFAFFVEKPADLRYMAIPAAILAILFTAYFIVKRKSQKNAD